MKTQLFLILSWILQLSPHSVFAWVFQGSHCHHLRSTRHHTSCTTCHQHVQDNEQDYPDFLLQVEETVSRVLLDLNTTTDNSEKDAILSLSPQQRESFGVARSLHTRLQAFRRNNDCPRCWLQRAHCICHSCPPLSLTTLLVPQINRIFVVMHHKEICLAVDTAKLILTSFPRHCHLVVAGIGPEHQPSMKELQQALADDKEVCRVLFPTEDAQTVEEMIMLNQQQQALTTTDNANDTAVTTKWDLVVLDGTWSQAQKMHRRYIPPTSQGGPPRIQLASTSLLPLQQQQNSNDDSDKDASTSQSHDVSSGHQQLRRHPIDWRTISTMEATRLLLKELAEQQQEQETDKPTFDGSIIWDTMLQYQSIANTAARRQLGPPRVK